VKTNMRRISFQAFLFCLLHCIRTPVTLMV
jgi:hypothetical protein